MPFEFTNDDYSLATSTPSPSLYQLNLVYAWELIDEWRKSTWRDRLLSLSEVDFGGSEDDDELSAIVVLEDGRIELNIKMNGNVLIPLEPLIPKDPELAEFEVKLRNLAEQPEAIERASAKHAANIDFSSTESQHEASLAIENERQSDSGDLDRGSGEGNAWAESVHRMVLAEFIYRIGHVEYLDDCYCDEDDFWCGEGASAEDLWSCVSDIPGLETHSLEGREYKLAFTWAASHVWGIRGRTVALLRTSTGVHDGVRWATEFSTPETLGRLKEYVSYRNDSPALLCGYSPLSYRGALELVECIVEEYAIDEPESTLVIVCSEFREFWLPFCDDSLEEFLANWREEDPRQPVLLGTNKLADPHYIEGFIAGALSKSDGFAEDEGVCGGR